MLLSVGAVVSTGSRLPVIWGYYRSVVGVSVAIEVLGLPSSDEVKPESKQNSAFEILYSRLVVAHLGADVAI